MFTNSCTLPVQEAKLVNIQSVYNRAFRNLSAEVIRMPDTRTLAVNYCGNSMVFWTSEQFSSKTFCKAMYVIGLRDAVHPKIGLFGVSESNHILALWSDYCKIFKASRTCCGTWPLPQQRSRSALCLRTFVNLSVWKTEVWGSSAGSFSQ